MTGKKARSRYIKSRKGRFTGTRKQELQQNQYSPPPAPRPIESSTPDKLNRSLDKIDSNCPLFAIEKDETMTRNRAFELGIVSGSSTTSKKANFGAYGCKIVDIGVLCEVLEKVAICKTCKNPNSHLKLFQDDSKRIGLHEKLFFQCTSCGETTFFETSSKLGAPRQGHSEVNMRLVHGGLTTGNGLSSLKKLCAALNLPPPISKRSYNNHLLKLELAASSTAEDCLANAATRLKRILKDKDEACMGLNIEHDAFPVSVTVDGTWQKRYGFSSLHGVVFVLSVETGEVLDFEIKSKVCFQCKAKGGKDKSSKEYITWFDKHKHECSVNHSKSSGSMETEAAITIFMRSIEKHNLKYTTYVGDGDSSSFGEVAEALFNKYGSEYHIVKEDCIGHIQKRMGSNLRNYKNKSKGNKLPDGGSIGGQGRLTDAVIDSMQNYYGNAIRRNQGNITSVKHSIWAIYFHMIAGENDTLAYQHRLCPSGANSWCKYQKDIALQTCTYDHSKCLPTVFRHELKPIFERLSETSLLERCQKGLTQNQNESLNNILWSKCPKRVFCGQTKLKSAASLSVLTWNCGAAGQGKVLEEVGLPNIGINTLRGYRIENATRVQDVGRKCKSSYLKRRKVLRQERKKCTKKGQSYMPGGFTVHKVPDNKMKKTLPSKHNSSPADDIPITFVDERKIFVEYSTLKRQKRK